MIRSIQIVTISASPLNCDILKLNYPVISCQAHMCMQLNVCMCIFPSVEESLSGGMVDKVFWLSYERPHSKFKRQNSAFCATGDSRVNLGWEILSFYKVWVSPDWWNSVQTKLIFSGEQYSVTFIRSTKRNENDAFGMVSCICMAISMKRFKVFRGLTKKYLIILRPHPCS